jgi:transcriptional regulator with XRE-family HTH domain
MYIDLELAKMGSHLENRLRGRLAHGKLAIMATNAVQPGPTSKRVSENIERLRRVRGLSQAQLANELTRVGRPMLDTAVSKMERGTRRIDVDDLVAIALALNVSPVALLMPSNASLEKVALTNKISLSEQITWLWAAGEAPASDFLLDPVGDHAEEEHKEYWATREKYLDASHPPGRFAPARAFGKTFGTLRAEVQRLFRYADDGDRDSYEFESDLNFEQQVSTVANWLNVLHSEVDELAAAIRRRRAYRKLMPVRHPGVPLDEAIPLEEFRNNPDGPFPRTLALRDLGIEDPDRPDDQ